MQEPVSGDRSGNEREGRVWLAALEGYYGPPLDPAERLDLADWLAGVGYDAYIYSPKDDPYQRARWREPYPGDALVPLQAMAATCRETGIGLGLTISPGLDWAPGSTAEVDALTRKVEQLMELDLAAFAINWDDVPGYRAELGADQGAAVATVIERLGPDGVRWFTCPIDYAFESPTPYVESFADAIAGGAELIWTGPSVVTATLDGPAVRTVREALPCEVAFAENFPVNDLGMANVLHLGPYPQRSSEARNCFGSVMVNFMQHPRSSRVGLELAARAWRDTESSPEIEWEALLGRQPELAALARASRSWLGDPGPDKTLIEWALAAGPHDSRLRDFLARGCRDGIDPALASEVEPWLDAWDREAEVMSAALDILEDHAGPATIQAGMLLASRWREARTEPTQIFGIRFAIYPSTRRSQGRLAIRADAVPTAENLTDVVVRRALSRVGTGVEGTTSVGSPKAEGPQPLGGDLDR